MQKEIFFFDEVESRLIDTCYQAIMAYSFDKAPVKYKEDDWDNYVQSTLFLEIQKYCYDVIDNKSNSFLHRYLSFSTQQIVTHFPLTRSKTIQHSILISLYNGNTPDKPLTEEALSIIIPLLHSYHRYYQLYVSFIEGLNNDFKAGLISGNSAKLKTKDTISEMIKYDDFNLFIKHLEYNYLLTNTVFSFKYTMKEQLDFLCKEILSNLIILTKDERKAYLNRLKYDLDYHKQNVWSSAEILEKWYDKYDSPKEDDIYFKKSDNIIYQILNSDKPKFGEEYNEAFNEDTEQIQDEFYNFYYGFYLDNAITFIVEQINELSPPHITPVGASQAINTAVISAPKLKTNLNVPQLAYLFKMLMDINPPIFDVKTNKEIYQFIEANFTTKGKDTGPTIASLNNLYSDVDKSTAVFWEEKLKKMLQDARKI